MLLYQLTQLFIWAISVRTKYQRQVGTQYSIHTIYIRDKVIPVDTFTPISQSKESHHHSTKSSWLPQTSRNRLVNIDDPHMTRYDLIFSLTCASRLTIIDLY